MVFTFSELENDPEDDREYIEWTFHECEPIKTKPLPNSLVAPFIIPYKPLSLTISQRFQLIYNENEDSEDEMCDYEDIDPVKEEEMQPTELINYNSKTGIESLRKIKLMLASKLKRRSIATKLGQRYMPRCGDLRARIGKNGTRTGKITLKAWTCRFGAKLEAKKLLFLPLLYKKYRSTGPKKTREELDIEIDLYMAQVRKKGKKMVQNAIKKMEKQGQVVDVTERVKEQVKDKVLTSNLFGGFGGPNWARKMDPEKQEKLKSLLDEELEQYINQRTNKRT